MGYYAKVIRSNFTVKKERCDDAHRAVCDPNRHDCMKRGGKWGGEPTEKPADSRSVSDNPDKWFSWMPWNYDETCVSLAEVLEALGFDVEERFGVVAYHATHETFGFGESWTSSA